MSGGLFNRKPVMPVVLPNVMAALVVLGNTSPALSTDTQLLEPTNSAVVRSALPAQLAQSGNEAVFDFDIPAGRLPQSLAAFSAVTQMQVLYTERSTFDHEAPALKGGYTAKQALSILLGQSGLIARETADGTITIELIPDTTGESAVLQPLTVEGQFESAYGPAIGYKADRSATGSKTDTPIRELPASVQVIPQEVIADQAAQNLKDVYTNASGVQQGGNTLNAQSEVLPLIRGFESPDLLRNGLRATTVGAVDLANVERVEVLKGPASILYGELEPGGVVNLVTKRPQATPQHIVEGQAGSFDFYRGTIDSTGAVSEDGSLMYRLNTAYTNSDSFRDFVELERFALAPSILWQPTDQSELLLDGSFVHEEQPYDTGIPLDTSGNPLVDPETFFNDPDLKGRTIDDYALSAQVTHDFTDWFSIRSQAQFHRADARNESIRPRAVAVVGGVNFLGLRYQNEDRTDDEYQFVVDTVTDFHLGSTEHKLLVGGEYIYQNSDFRRFRQNIAAVQISNDVVVDFTPPESQPQQVILAETRWAGFYAQDQISLLSDGRLKLLFGGRYDILEQDQETDAVSAPGVDERAFSTRAGILYEFTDTLSVYASAAESFTPQLSGTLDADGNPLPPEEGLQFEIGVKAGFFDDRLSTTVSVYDIEKKNVAVTDAALLAATGQIASLPGVDQGSRGFEFDITGAVTDEIKLIGNYSYIETEVLKNESDPTAVGDRLGGVPTHSARLWGTYDFSPSSSLHGLGFGAGVRWVSETPSQFDIDIQTDAYAVMDAAVWYSWETMRASLNIGNVLNTEYIERANNSAIAHPGEPFSVVGSFRVRF